MFNRKKFLVIIFAFIIAALVAFCIFKLDIKYTNNSSENSFNTNEAECVKEEEDVFINVTEDNSSLDLKKEENIEVKIQTETNQNKNTTVNIIKNEIQTETEPLEKELTVGEMFKNKYSMNTEIPTTRPRADVVLINEEIKIVSPEKYSFK